LDDGPIAQPRPNSELTGHRDALWAPIPRGRVPLNHGVPGRCEAAGEGFEPPSEVAPAAGFKTRDLGLEIGIPCVGSMVKDALIAVSFDRDGVWVHGVHCSAASICDQDVGG
jgi:hypothetical protein